MKKVTIGSLAEDETKVSFIDAGEESFDEGVYSTSVHAVITDSISNPGMFEVVKINGSSSGFLLLERGADGSTPLSWPEGSVVYSDLTSGEVSFLAAMSGDLSCLSASNASYSRSPLNTGDIRGKGEIHAAHFSNSSSFISSGNYCQVRFNSTTNKLVGKMGSSDPVDLGITVPNYKQSSSRAVSGVGTNFSVSSGSPSPGELVIVTFSMLGQGFTSNFSAPSGFVQIGSTGTVSSGDVRLACYYKVAGSSEPSSYTFTTSSLSISSLNLIVIQGAGSSPIADVQTISSTSSTSVQIHNHSYNNELIVSVLSFNQFITQSGISAPSSFTKTSSTNTNVNAESCIFQGVGSSTVGVKSWSWSGSANSRGICFKVTP